MLITKLTAHHSPHNEGNIIPELTHPGGIDRLHRFNHCCKGFASLRDQGYVSDALVNCIPGLLRMDELLTLAKTKNLSVATAKELLSYIWYNFRTLTQTNEMRHTEFEDCVRHAIVIYAYAKIFADPAGEISWLAEPIKDQLLRVDIERLLHECPEAMLWICLVIGPFAKGETRNWFFDLLMQARQVLSAHDLQEALLDYAENQFLWTRAFDEGAEQFWDDTTWYRDGEIKYGLATPKNSRSPPNDISPPTQCWGRSPLSRG